MTREGAGKTFTAVHWILKNALDKNKKVLWIAHRHLLLEQACQAFQTNATSDVLANRDSYKFRVISGKHDRMINIKNNEDVLIISKDSLRPNLKILDNWLDDDIYLVIDEAHHATAKTYRSIIEYLNGRVNNLKIIGLTATPFRTDEKEKGLLGEVFYDDIVYDIDLKTLINKRILSRPIFEECNTELLIGNNIGLKALKSIERLDQIPIDIAEQIANNSIRNSIIVNRYMENEKRYGKTVIFALNRLHAITLKALFEDEGIESEFIISGTSSEFTGIETSIIDTEKNIKKYRDGTINVLINVNILTEGVDLPETKTIFLTRPTISKTLMTQMIGRGLRGEKAGGTKEAYIVSFIDNWNENISWINPETILTDQDLTYVRKGATQRIKNIRFISIKKIEEFAKMLDSTIDNSHLERVEYIERVPVGMYNFTYLETEVDINCQILIYNSTKPYFDMMIKDLDKIFEHFNIDEECIQVDILEKMVNAIKDNYFDRDIVPSFNKHDIEDLLKYYLQKGIEPNYYELDFVDRESLDISKIAKHIYDEDIKPKEQSKYLMEIWNDETSLIQIYFNKFTYFVNQVNTELFKLTGIIDMSSKEDIVIINDDKDIREMTISEIGNYYPEKEKEIRDTIFNKNILPNDKYHCMMCGKESHRRVDFHIDHIKPLSKGGFTEEKNLQILCRICNLRKGDTYE